MPQTSTITVKKALLKRENQRLAQYSRERAEQMAARKAARKAGKPDYGKVVDALEVLIHDYRAGRGDVLNRLVNDDVPEQVSLSLGDALNAALFGKRAIIPPPRDGEIIICNRLEHEAFCAIGGGSAERGATKVISTARAWLRRDRAELVSWLVKTLPTIEDIVATPTKVSERGLNGGEYWQIPVASGSWFLPLQKVAEEASTARDVLADAVVRALVLKWGKTPWAKAATTSRKLAA